MGANGERIRDEGEGLTELPGGVLGIEASGEEKSGGEELLEELEVSYANGDELMFEEEELLLGEVSDDEGEFAEEELL